MARLGSTTYLDIHARAAARLRGSSLVRQCGVHAQFIDLAHLVAQDACPLIQLVRPLAQIVIFNVDPIAVFVELVAFQV